MSNEAASNISAAKEAHSPPTRLEELLSKVEDNGDRLSLNIIVKECLVEPQKFVLNDQQETLLHLACRKNYFYLVRALIEVYCCTLEVTDKFGNSPFHTACANECLEIVQYFCCYISSLPCTHLNNDGDTVLHVACRTGSAPLVRIIIHDMLLRPLELIKPLKLNMYNDDIFSYIFKDHQILLSCQPDFISEKNKFGFTPVHTACYYGHYDIIQFFFSEGRSRLNINLSGLVPSLLFIAYSREHHNGRKIIDYLHTIAADGINVTLIPTKCYSFEVNKFSKTLHSGKYSAKYVDENGSPRMSVVESGLFFAARHANASLFEYLSSKKEVSYDLENCFGDSLLHAACVSSDLQIIKMAYDYFSEHEKACLADKRNKQGDTCLHVACEWGASMQVIEFLIGKGFSVNAVNKKGQTLLHLAIIHKKKALFDMLLHATARKINLNAITSDDETPLHLATYSSEQYYYADAIINHPGCICLYNHPDKYGDTPLFNACRTGDKKMLELLVEHQSNPDLLIVNRNTNETIFNIACRLNDAKILDYLFEKLSLDYPIKLQNYLGQTLLHIACMRENLDMVNCLDKWKENYSWKDDVNLIDTINELTLLQYACTKNDVVLVEKLLDRGSDPNLKNKQEDSVLHVCCRKNLGKVAEFIQERCSLTVRNRSGDTPLHVACKYDNFGLALILLKNMPGSSVFDCYNWEGDCLLHIAVTKKGALQFLEYVVEKKICSHSTKNKNTGNTALHDVCQSERNFVIENAMFLFNQDYDRECWYNKEMESPLSLAVHRGHYKFLLSIVSKKLIKPWHLKNCVIAKSPFSNRYANTWPTVEQVNMPLAHDLIYSSMKWNHNSRCDRCTQIKNIIVQLIDFDDSVATITDSQGCTLLHYLALSSCKVLANDLAADILKKVSLNQFDIFNNSSLHIACMCNNQPLIYHILQTSDGLQIINEKNYLGKTPAALLQLHNGDEPSPCEYFLVASGADLEITRHSLTQQSSIGVLVLGDSKVGKTTLINALEAVLNCNCDQALNNSPPTIGIETKSIVRNGYMYTFYDFAGEPEFENSHSLRLENLLSSAAESPLSRPFVFLLLVNGKDPCDVNKHQIDKWFRFIRRHARVTNSGIHMAFICSHDDCFESHVFRGNRRAELKEYINNLDISMLALNIYEIPILLNGLEPDTTPLHLLLSYLEDLFLSANPVTLQPSCQELLSFLQSSFPDPCQVKDVIEKVKNSREFALSDKRITMTGMNLAITHEVDKFINLLKQLHFHDHIVLLMTSDNALDWWIINQNKQNTLFNELIGIFAPVKLKVTDFPCITNQTGILAAEKLSEIAQSLKLEINMLENYLTCMKFCFVVDDKDVLKLIVGDDEIAQDKCLFFPGLIKQNQKNIDLNKDDSCYYNSMWVLENQGSNFGSRFLHMLLYQMMKFVSGRRKLICEKKLSIWKNGIFWRTRMGVDFLLEVVNEQKNIVALFQCSPEKSTKLAQLRHEVISEINKVLCEHQSHDNIPLHTNEFLVYPATTDFCIPPLAENARKVPVSEICGCFADEPERYIKRGSDKIPLQDILGFDSYLSLRKSTLQLLNDSNVESVGKVFGELSHQHLEEIIEFHHCVEDWIDENSKSPVYNLIQKLNKYSMFSLSHIIQNES